VLSREQVLVEESALTFDLNGDGQTGLTYTAGVATVAGVNLGQTQLGYAIRSGAGSPLQITYGGQYVTPSVPGGGWTVLAAAASGAGYAAYLKNSVSAQFAKWQLSAAGVVTGGTLLASGEVFEAEVTTAFDLNNDGTIGPFAIRQGTATRDDLTGSAFLATFGFAGDDTLASGSPYATGFDVLIGGKGNDAYVVNPGKNCLIADYGSDPANSISASGVGLFDPGTAVATIDKGKTLVVDNPSSKTRVYFYDWQNPVNRIQTIALSDGNYSFQQAQARVAALGAQVPDYTWAQWDALNCGGALAKLGLASSGAVDALASYYRNVDSAGGL